MAIHDYIIDNQSAPAFRSDLNGALQAIVTQNSNATAPTTTYANMIWYDTAANQLKKRNEANSAWIVLGTVDETLGTFNTSGAPPSQVQATWDTGTSTTESLISPAKLDAKVRSELNATGTAPIYACRAWVNFNGTGTPAILASGNVTSITDNGVGDYTLNFTTAMPDANYSVVGSGAGTTALFCLTSLTAGSARVTTRGSTSGAVTDLAQICVSVFR